MAKATIDVKVIASGDMQSWWIAVDQSGIISTTQTQIEVDADSEHHIFWWAIGDAGAQLKLSIKQGEDERLKAQETIAPGYSRAAGVRKFKTS